MRLHPGSVMVDGLPATDARWRRWLRDKPLGVNVFIPSQTCPKAALHDTAEGRAGPLKPVQVIGTPLNPDAVAVADEALRFSGSCAQDLFESVQFGLGHCILLLLSTQIKGSHGFTGGSGGYGSVERWFPFGSRIGELRCHRRDDPIVRAVDQIVQVAGRDGPEYG